MKIILAIIIILLLAVVYLLFKEICFQINSDSHIYQIILNRHVGVSALWLQEELVMQFQFYLFKKRFYPFRKKVGKEGKPGKVEKDNIKVKKVYYSKVSMKLFIEMIQTFRLRKLKINVDTDDYVLNAYLYPIFNLLSKKNKQLSINYNGNFELVMDLRFNAFRILKTFVIYKLKSI